MHHSFSNESFLKPTHIIRLPQAQNRIQNDITLPREYFNHKQSLEHLSDESPQKSNLSTHSISKLKKKIKQIKSALKIAEQHNEELHLKLNQQKRYFSDQKNFLEMEASKYKSLYEMLIENYQAKSLQLNEVKKRFKKLEKQQDSKANLEIYQSKKSSPQFIQEQEENIKKMKEIVTQQEVSLEHMRHQNKILREEVMLKSKKISEYEILLETYQTEEKINRLSNKHHQQFLEISSKLQSVEEDNKKLRKEKQITITKIKRLEVELESSKNFKDSIQKENLKTKKEVEDLRIEIMVKERLLSQVKDPSTEKWKPLYDEILLKYNELLKFSYELQKDFERELHTMAKEMTRREIVKNTHERL